MSRIKLLLDVIEDIRSLGDSLQAIADAMASDEPTEVKPKKKSEKTETVKKETEKVTLEDVRGVLAELSRAGKTAEVKAIITKYGADRLSDINPSKFAGVLKDAEVLKNA